MSSYTISLHDALPICDIIDRYNEEISQGLYIEDKIVQMDISQEETKIIGEKLFKAYNTKLIENKLIKDRKSTRLNSSHVKISYAVFCLKKKKYLQHRL